MTTAKAARPHKARPTDPRQGDFLALLTKDGVEPVPLPGAELVPAGRSLSEDQRVRRLINEAIRASHRNRDELAAAMSRADEPVTAAMLNSWTGAARINAAPLKHYTAFLRAIGPEAAFQFATALHDGTGLVVLDERWAAYARIGQMVVAAKAAQDESNRLATALRPAWGRP